MTTTEQEGGPPTSSPSTATAGHQQQTIEPEISQDPPATCNKKESIDNDENQRQEQRQDQKQGQKEIEASRDIIKAKVQDAREWTPLPCGDHPRLEDIREAYSDIPSGHPELLFLFAIKSEFGYWLWMPKSKNYYGSTPKKGISARVEKVRHNGKEV